MTTRSPTHQTPLLSTRNNWKLILFLILPIQALAFNQFAFITADPDLWGHIKFGEASWLQKSLQPVNFYSYTAPDYRWINHEWIAEIIFYAIYYLFGSTGLLAFKFFLGQTIIHIITIYNLRNKANPWVLIPLMLMAIPVLAPGFMVRPHLWTTLFFTIFILLLHKGLEENPKILLWIPLLMLIWVNCHGGVVAGLGIFFAVTLTESIRSLMSGEKLNQPLMIAFVASCLMVLINPSGIELWEFFYHSLSQSRNISEWNSVPLWGTEFIFLKILTILFLITLFLPGKKQSWKIVMVFLVIYFGFKHQRHTILTAIVLTFYLPLVLSKGLTLWGENYSHLFKTGNWMVPAQLILLVFMCLQFLDGYKKYSQNQFKILVEPQVYPSYLIQFMEENEFKGNILVPFDWGEFLIWKLPDSKISIDGRFRTAYPETIINWNQKVYSIKNPDTKLLNQYPTDFIVTRKKVTPNNYLANNEEWIKIYEDLIASLFVKKNHDSILKDFNNDRFIHPKNPPSYSFP